MQPKFRKERLGRIQTMLGVDLEPDSGELVSTIVQLYIDEKIRSDAWADKTFVTYKVILESLITFLDHKGIKLVTYRDAQTIKNQLQKLLSSIGKRATYKDKIR
jgi:site-specific recombinase XerD